MLLSFAACSSNDKEPQVLIEKIDNLSSDFIMGADVSSLLSLEESGAVFYDFDGNVSDALKTMGEAGINYIRVRVWNDPYDSDGNGYGGGNCDINTAVELGKRAAKYGMGLLLDLHYSDFWADPSKQQVPKAWADYSIDEKAQAVYDYTVSCIEKLTSNGVKVGMIQIGNETTNGFCGETAVPKIMKLMASASKAIRDTDSSIKIAVHYTNPEKGNYKQYAANLKANGVDYDIFASSYYPYWHGTLDNLAEQLSYVKENYGKSVMVVETSYAYTLDDGDEHGNTIGEQLTYEKSYPFTVQGQASAVADVIKTVSDIGGIGVFYWEAAWIPVPGDTWEERSAKWEQFGSGWASSYAKDYDPSDAGVYFGGSAVDNQALFDFDGHPLDSLNVFKYVRTGTDVPVKVDSIEPVYVTFKLNNPITLPETVPVIYNDGTQGVTNVIWDESIDLAAISASEVGTYAVSGTADGEPVYCYINMVEENYIENYSFEDSDYSMWRITNIADGEQTDFQTKVTDAYSGSVSLHFWNADAVEFTVEQDITGLRSGEYVYSIQVQGGDASQNAEMYIYVEADGERYEQSFMVASWREWQHPVIDSIKCESGSMTVGIYIKSDGGCWGTIDDVLLNPCEEK